MKKSQSYFIIIFSLLIVCTNILAIEKNRVDSLKSEFLKAEGVDKIEQALVLSKALVNSDIDLSYQYLQEGEKIAEKENNLNWRARCTQQRGFIHYRKLNYDSALFYFNLGLKSFLLTNDPTDLSRIYRQIGNVYFDKYELEKVQEYYQKSLLISLNHKLEFQEAITLYTLGVLYEKLGDFKAGKEVLDRSIEILKKRNNLKELASAYNNMGNLFIAQKRWEDALKYFELTLEIDSALDFKQGISGDYNNIGIVYKRLGNLTKALSYHYRALEIDEKVNNDYGAAANWNNIGSSYLQMEEYGKAIEPVLNGLKISKEKEINEFVLDGLKNLGEAYSGVGDYEKAYVAIKERMKLTASIYNEQSQKTIEKLQSQLLAQKEQIKLEHKEAELQEVKQSKKLTIIILIFVMILALFITNRYYLRQKLIKEKEHILLESRALHLQMNPHFIFNSMGAISNFISKNESKQAIRYLAKFAKLMRATLESSKKMTTTIQAEIDSLNHYLLLEQLRFKEQFDFEITAENGINKEIKLPSLFIQPYVENAVLHGIVPKKEKGLIKVNFRMENSNLICSIEDNGIGRAEAKNKSSAIDHHLSSSSEINKKRVNAINLASKGKMKVNIIDLIDDIGKSEGTKVEIILNSSIT